MSCRRIAVAALCSASLFALAAPAERASAQYRSTRDAAAVYGRGVHEYFAHRMHEADNLLSQVINAGSTDPRAYYFRGLARLRQGRRYEAEMDMQVGAAYEAQRKSSRYAVGQSLMRVQGSDRRILESYRRQARAVASEEVSQLQQATRSIRQTERRDARVLRRKPIVTLDQLLQPSDGPILGGNAPAAAAPTQASPSSADPFAASPDASPRSADAPTQQDPFGAGPQQPAGGVPSDPFAEGPATSGDADNQPYAGAPGAPSDADPFSGAGGASDDPFGATTENVTQPSSDQATTTDAKVKPSKLAGILGRVIGRAASRATSLSDLGNAVQGIKPPAGLMGGPTEQPEVDQFNFGPGTGGNDPFADPNGDVDPFDDSGNDPFEPTNDGVPRNTPYNEAEDSSSDDDYGDSRSDDGDNNDPFGEDPFGIDSDDASNSTPAGNADDDSTDRADGSYEEDPFENLDDPFGDN